MNIKPWMDKTEIEKIIVYLKPEYKMFEWGCGGSTLYFSKYVSLYRSIENNYKWFRKISNLISSNTEIYHYPNTDNYNNYINAISNYEDQYDVILIDGRCRVKCAIQAKSHLRNNGLLFVHDYFNRPYYNKIEKEYTLIDSIKDTEQTLAVFRNEIHN
jgi:hypothetical protein